MQGVSGRGGEISVQGVVGRMLSPFDPALASKYVDDAESLGGTAEWRQKWWREIWNSINHTDSTHFFFGHGYGYPIADLSGYVEEGVRTPHNIFFYSLAYGGWCGAAIFAFFQLTVIYALYRSFKMTGQAFGVGIWIVNITMALLGNSLETPFGAIPFYLLVGVALRPLFEHPVVRLHNQMLEREEEAMASAPRRRAPAVAVGAPRTAVR
jgi:O-antigen ligase